MLRDLSFALYLNFLFRCKSLLSRNMRMSIREILMDFLFSFRVLKNSILAKQHIWSLPLALKHIKVRVDKAMHLYSQKDRLARAVGQHL